MNKYIEKRRSKRIKHYDTIMISDELSGYYYYAQIDNVSTEGMGFESDQPLEPGSAIDIWYENPRFKSAPKSYRGTVKWCQPLPETSVLSYGCGVKFR